MKYNGPKARLCRRQGMNLFGSDKYDKILQRKPNTPGKTPRAQIGKLSEFGTQLREKQKVRSMYGITEKQFKNMYLRATKVAGQTGDALKRMLETRLDNVIYRAGFAMTRPQARQFVGHGLFMVNGVRVTVPSYQVKPGEVITVRAQVKNSPVFTPILAAHEKYTAPDWIKVDSSSMKVDVISVPSPDHAEKSVEMQQVIEFYSR